MRSPNGPHRAETRGKTVRGGGRVLIKFYLPAGFGGLIFENALGFSKMI
jgi:hypothetical protein